MKVTVTNVHDCDSDERFICGPHSRGETGLSVQLAAATETFHHVKKGELRFYGGHRPKRPKVLDWPLVHLTRFHRRHEAQWQLWCMLQTLDAAKGMDVDVPHVHLGQLTQSIYDVSSLFKQVVWTTAIQAFLSVAAELPQRPARQLFVVASDVIDMWSGYAVDIMDFHPYLAVTKTLMFDGEHVERSWLQHFVQCDLVYTSHVEHVVDHPLMDDELWWMALFSRNGRAVVSHPNCPPHLAELYQVVG